MTGTDASDEAAIREVLTSQGMTIEDPPAAEPPAADPGAAPPSEQPAKPGEETPAAAGGESGPASEAGERTQEQSQAAGEDGKKPSRGNFKSKIEKAEARIERLQEDLDAERGGKAKLQQQLAEAQAELERLKKAAQPEGEKPAAKPDDGPARPKRPTLEDFDFDQDKFNTALAKYEDEDLPAYYRELNKIEFNKQWEAKQEADRQKEEERKAAEAHKAFVERRDSGIAAYEDWDDVIGNLPDGAIELPGMPGQIVEDYIRNADSPADLIYFFAKDATENDGESQELARIGSLPPLIMVRELTRLEQRLAAEREGKTKPAAPAGQQQQPRGATPQKPETPAPAKPKPVAVPQPPITPVGSRTAATTDTLEAAAARGDGKAYRQLRAQGVDR